MEVGVEVDEVELDEAGRGVVVNEGLLVGGT